MKNININKINKPDYISEVEFHLLNNTNPKTINSLGQSESVSDAIEFTKDLILNSSYNSIIPLNDKIIAKIIYESFESGRTIQEQLSIFAKKISPKVAMVRVETGSIIADYANGVYLPNSKKKTLII